MTPQHAKFSPRSARPAPAAWWRSACGLWRA